MRILIWHVHGAWTTAFVHGPHRYLIPTEPGRGPWGRGRARTYPWPDTAVEIGLDECAGAEVDLVILQRTEELDGLAERWLGGRVPGRDVPAIFVEHNSPQGRIADMRHPAAGREGVTVAHVTHFNALFWDTGDTPARVIEHGIVDPGPLFTGELPRACAVINEPARRNRVTGTDLLARFGGRLGIDLFGMGSEEVGGLGDLPQARLHAEMARRRVYLHTARWTSLGLSLIEAMHLGMPVVALATTEVPRAVPPEAGVVSSDPDELADALEGLGGDRRRAMRMGRAARAHALERFGLARFLDDWDRLLEEVCT